MATSPDPVAPDGGRAASSLGWAPRRPGIVVPATGIFLAEAFLFLGTPSGRQYGLLVHGLTLLVCAIGPIRYDEDAGLFFAFALVPTFRLVNFGLPVVIEQPLYQLLIVYLLVLPALLLVGRVPSIPTPPLGLRRGILLGPIAVPVGAALAFVEYRLVRPQPLLAGDGALQLLVVGLVMYGVVAMVEEWLFRGILQGTITTEVGSTTGIVVASAVFASVHSQFGSVPEVLFAGGVGLVLGLVFEHTESLLAVVLIHGTVNLLLFGVLPIS